MMQLVNFNISIEYNNSVRREAWKMPGVQISHWRVDSPKEDCLFF